MKKILSLTTALMLFSLVFISAQGFQYKSQSEYNQYNQGEAMEIMNKFQNKYMYNFSGNSTYEYKEIEDGKLRLEIKEQKRFLFFNVNMKSEYDINENGEIIKEKHNFWSRILNQDKVN
jgi:hypothetical protein